MPIKRSRNTFWVCTAFKIFVVVAEVNEVETIWCLTRWKSSPVVSSLNGLKKRIGLTTFNLGVSLSLILVLALSVKKRKKKKKGCVCVSVCAPAHRIFTQPYAATPLTFFSYLSTLYICFCFFPSWNRASREGKGSREAYPRAICVQPFSPLQLLCDVPERRFFR